MNLFEKFEVLEAGRDIRGKKLKEEYFTKLLRLENSTSFHDCLSDIFVVIDSKKFMERLHILYRYL